MNIQMLSKQIKDSRKELEALQVDEAELTRLHGEKSAELDALRKSQSRDFASMAAFEGQRSALATMLSEQRGEIGQVQSRISQLESQQEREAALTELQAQAVTLKAHREETDALLSTTRLYF